MNRLSPLIVRRVGPMAAARPLDKSAPFEGMDAERWMEDLKLFATGWIGGLVFFGAFFG